MASQCWTSSFLVLCGLLCRVGSIDVTLQPFYNESDTPCQKTKTVDFLVMAPFPDPTGLDPGEDTGPILIPAAMAAASNINQRCDILGDYRIRVLVADSGCDIITKAISSLVNATFDPQYHVVGIIGPRCSQTAIEIGDFLARPGVDLLHISPSATSLRLLNQTIFPNTFRALGSSREFVTMYLALIRDLGIKKVAIFFEHISSVQATAANDFHRRILDKFVDADVTVLGISNFFIPLNQIQNQYRLVFVFGGEEIARRLLCLAFRKGMTSPDYQFIFSEIIFQDILRNNVSVNVNGETLECTGGTGDMTVASLGIILSLAELIRKDTDTVLVDNRTTDDFYDAYFDAQDEYKAQTGMSRFVVEPNNHQTTYYDSMWAFALALNASMPRFESELGVSLGDYSYGHPSMTNIIRHELLDVEFEGTRGIVDFSDETFDGENVTAIDVFIVLDTPKQLETVANFSPENISITIGNRSAIIPDSFDRSIIAPPVYVETVVLLIVALTATTLVIFHGINLKWTDAKSIKVTSPLLNNLIFSGCYIYLISIVFLSFKETNGTSNPVAFAVKCSGFIWCETIAFSLIFGTICVKTWRILRIFSVSSAKVISHLDDHFLVLYISLVVVVDVVFNILWNAVDPWFMDQTIGLREVRLSCNCDHISVWIGVLLAQKTVLAIAVLYLSIATRQIKRKEYKQTKSTNMLVYIYVLLNSLLVPLFLLLLNSESVLLETVSYLSICLKNILCVVMCILLVFLPPVLPFLKEKWKALRNS